MSPNAHLLDQRGSQTEAQRPNRTEVEAAVRTIIRWTGEDPDRDGLIETPTRVTRSFEQGFPWYGQDPAEILEKIFEEIEGYDEMIVLRDIRFKRHCEYHMAPIIGHAWVAYIPNGGVVGISKLARVVDICAKRLQIHEKMTAQIASTINDVLKRARGWRDYQDNASLHDQPRRAQVWDRSGHQSGAGVLPRRCADPPGVPRHGRLIQSASSEGGQHGGRKSSA
jgi:GTP cyclohydrolase IA